jgi:hypothetical protein
MEMKSLRNLMLAAATAVLFAGCESQSTAPSSSGASSGAIAARDQLVADLQQCSQQHGYNPQASGLPENALAPNELVWRQCARDAARQYGQAHPSMSSLFNQLVSEDIEMTTAIQNGTMTRSQRRARLEQLIEQIKTAEDAEIKAAAVEQERQQEQLRNVVDNARGFAY